MAYTLNLKLCMTEPPPWWQFWRRIWPRPVWEVCESITWSGRVGLSFYRVDLPVGTRTNFASIPWPFSALLSPFGPWARAAALHDYLVGEFTGEGDTVPRHVADSIFYRKMVSDDVPRIMAQFMYMAARAWSKIKG